MSSQILATITGSFLPIPFSRLFKLHMDRSLVSGPIIINSSRSHFGFILAYSLWLTNPLYKRYAIFFFSCSGSFDFRVFFTWLCSSFQLSLTLLFLYRCMLLFSLRGLVPLSSNFVSMFYSSCDSSTPHTGLLTLSRFLAFLSSFFDSLCLARHYYIYLSWFLFLLLLRCFSSQRFFLSWDFSLLDTLVSLFLI